MAESPEEEEARATTVPPVTCDHRQMDTALHVENECINNRSTQGANPEGQYPLALWVVIANLTASASSVAALPRRPNLALGPLG